MLYTIFTSIVFISEIIIASAIIICLLRIDKYITNLNEFVIVVKPKIKDICDISKAISVQIKELSKIFVENIKKKNEDMFFHFVIRILGTLILIKINSKFIKKIVRSKSFKILNKTLRLVINML